MATKLSAATRIELNDGNSIPIFGLGVFQSFDGAVCEHAVETALEAGYRHIDTAADYGNEASIGRVVSTSGIPRAEIFLTTKLWPPSDMREVRGKIQSSLDKLRTDYVDLFLVHWPIGCYRDAWKVLVDAKARGVCRSIGVSNYTIRRFEQDFFPRESVLPAVNQIELHAFNQQRDLVRYCATRGIGIEAYSPLARGEKLKDPTVLSLARDVGKSPAQVLIRFLLQRGIVAIPKSPDPARIRENIDVFDFELDDAQMTALDELNDEAYFALHWRPPGYY